MRCGAFPGCQGHKYGLQWFTTLPLGTNREALDMVTLVIANPTS